MVHDHTGQGLTDEVLARALRDEDGTIAHFCSEQRDISPEFATQGEVARLLDEVTEQRETARMLLALSQALGRRSTREDIAQTIAAAVPRIAGSDRSAIGLWHDAEDRLTIAGQSGWPAPLDEAVRTFEASPDAAPELAELLDSGRPLLVDGSSSAWALDLLERFGVRAFAAMPFFVGGQFAGIVLAHWTDSDGPGSVDPVLEERMSGLAGLASVALDNVRLLEEARWRAAHDPLTLLPNRARLETVLENALGTAAVRGGHVGVLFCDVDGFKRANDDLGHRGGDAVLVEVGQRIRGSIRETDTVARTGGDEFVVVLPSIAGEAEAQVVAERVRAAMCRPIELDGRAVTVEVSIGVAVSAELGDDIATTGDRLVRDADEDMYRTKAITRAADESTHPADAVLLAELRDAVREGQVHVEYQPQIDLGTGEVVAAEALLRWRHPRRGAVPPAEFVPLAERTGMIDTLGDLVLEDACALARRVRRSRREFEVAVNVSPLQLGTSTFADGVLEALRRHALPPEALTIEITESIAVDGRSIEADVLRRLENAGVHVAMDDFGIGFASLAQLHHLPITDLKIDRSFVRDGERGAHLVEAIASMAHALDARVVAEGIESERDLDMVRARGCDRGQGYYIASPMSADDLITTLRRSGTPLTPQIGP